MSNSTIEAVLRLSAKLGSMAAFGQLSNKLNQVNQKALAFNRTQSAMAKAQNAVNGLMATSAMRFVGPAALGYGAMAATKEYAAYERQLTRTGLKIGATRKEMTDLGAAAMAVAQRYAVSNDSVIETVDAYAETGATLQDIRADIDGIVKAQQAMGGEGRDVVNTWDTARKNFGLMSKDAERFFDIMAAGGNAGKFEGSDMAQYLPGLMPRASILGMSGLSGTASLVGALEVMRDQTGTSEKAATALGDFLDKLNSPTVQKNFKKMNVDLPKALKEGRKNGEPLFVTMGKVLDKATHGDTTLLGHLFSEQDSRSFATMLMQKLPTLLKTIDELRDKSKGTIELNVKAVTQDAEASIQHLSNSWDKFVKSTGQSIAEAGVPGLLDQASRNQDMNNAVNAQLTKEGKGLGGRFAWFLLHGFDPEANAEKAHAGGYRSEEERRANETYRQYSESRRAGMPRDPTFGAGVDANGVPFPLSGGAPLGPVVNSNTYAAQHGRGSSFRPGTADEGIARPLGTGFLGQPPADIIDVIDGRATAAPKRTPNSTMKDWFELPSLDGLKRDFNNTFGDGGKVGQSISDGMSEGGQAAGNEFAKMLAGMGKQIGADAAAAFNANVRPVPVAQPSVRADTGKSDAGRMMGPR